MKQPDHERASPTHVPLYPTLTTTADMFGSVPVI